MARSPGRLALGMLAVASGDTDSIDAKAAAIRLARLAILADIWLEHDLESRKRAARGAARGNRRG